MAQYKYAEIGDTVYFWFAANTTAGAAGDGASPLYDVRLAGAVASAAPTASGTPTLLTHANYTDGLHEIAIDTTGYAAGEYAVFCTLTISTVNPAGFCGSFKLRAAGAAALAVDTVAISGDATAADNCELMFDGTGYAGGTAKLQVDLNKVFGTALSESGAGYLAAAFKKFFDKATPTGTINSIPDAVAGAAGGIAIVGSRVDLVDAPNATAITAIQSGLASSSSVSAVKNLLNVVSGTDYISVHGWDGSQANPMALTYSGTLNSAVIHVYLWDLSNASYQLLGDWDGVTFSKDAWWTGSIVYGSVLYITYDGGPTLPMTAGTLTISVKCGFGTSPKTFTVYLPGIEATGLNEGLIRSDGQFIDWKSGVFEQFTPSVAGDQMDLVNAPNATAITAIQSGLALDATVAKEASLGTAQTGDLYGLVTGVDTELSSVPTTTSSIINKIKFLFQYFRNRRTFNKTTGIETLYKENTTTSLGTSTSTDDGTTFDKGELG